MTAKIISSLYGRWAYYFAIWTLVFWLTDWDVRIAAWFYQPSCSPEGWWVDCQRWLHYLFYESVPWLSIFILGGSLAVMAWTYWQRQVAPLRIKVGYFLLVFVLGAGVLVNGVFKEHWGRPRPADTVYFGNEQPYVPPGLYASAYDGRSFPSGHSAMGFGFVALWFLWRERYPRLARCALCGSMTLGCLIGLTRMAAGGHYLSDVMWSGFIMLLTAYLLARFMLQQR